MDNLCVDQERRRFLRAATSLLGGIGLAFAAAPFVCAWYPSRRTQAMGAPIKVDISQLKPGTQMTVAWRGQPVWIVHRTEAMLAGLPSLDNTLRDPQSLNPQQPTYAQNEYRAIKAPYLVLVGLCTHLGCVPLFRPEKGSLDPGWPGGFFCPCHGSRFDLAGRVFKGVPAPLNLLVPPYHYEEESVLIVGEDKALP